MLLGCDCRDIVILGYCRDIVMRGSDTVMLGSRRWAISDYDRERDVGPKEGLGMVGC